MGQSLRRALPPVSALPWQPEHDEHEAPDGGVELVWLDYPHPCQDDRDSEGEDEHEEEDEDREQTSVHLSYYYGKRSSRRHSRRRRRRHPHRRLKPSSANQTPAPADLSHLPPEIALTVLSNLNATDLCLAACVWQQLASDEILWQGLCKQQWPAASVYKTEKRHSLQLSYRKVYLLLDEATLTFNSDAHQGMTYLFEHGLVEDRAEEIAAFFHHTSTLAKRHVRLYLQGRPDVVQCMFTLQDYVRQFLPNALRKCFAKLEAPNDRGVYLQNLLDSFSKRFYQCNPDLGYSVDSIYVMCFSLILLSVDLTSPHVKNKMSKREFIRNTRNAVHQARVAANAGAGAGRAGAQRGDDLFGEMYDNVFLRGHVSEEGKALQKPQQQFVPGYLAMFL